MASRNACSAWSRSIWPGNGAGPSAPPRLFTHFIHQSLHECSWLIAIHPPMTILPPLDPCVWVWVRVRVCTYVYKCTYTGVHKCACISVHKCAQVFIGVHICVHIYAHMCTYVHKCASTSVANSPCSCLRTYVYAASLLFEGWRCYPGEANGS